MSPSRIFLATLMIGGLFGSASIAQTPAPAVKQSVEERATKRRQAAAERNRNS